MEIYTVKTTQKWSESLFYCKWKLISGAFCKYIIIKKKNNVFQFIFQKREIADVIAVYPTETAVVQMQRGALDNPLIISCIGIL